jgi:ABC-type glycerol-3-phosphate transport system substrate-binding protein
MRRAALVVAGIATAALLAACSSGSSASSSSTAPAGSAAAGGSAAASADSGAPVKLTLWHNYGTEQNAVATKALTDAYTAKHPNVTFDIVAQPGDNYFSLLQAAAVSQTGPDLAVMWTGLFDLKYQEWLTNLKDLVPADTLSKVQGLEWMSPGFDKANGPLVMPLERQFYIGFYNKKLLADAGVTAVPTTWDELYSACDKLKAKGVTPIVYGNGGQSLGATFYPWYDMSYLMSGLYPVEKWKGLYDGTIAWDSQANVDQLNKWAALKTKGCTNDDILTKTDNLDDFTSGKAAMIIDGTWDTQKFTDVMKDNVAAFVPPFSDSAVKGVIEYPGDGFSITKYSKNQQAAADFLTFLASPEGAAIVDKAGLIPALEGTTTTNPVNEQMLGFAANDGMTRYPMLDNVVQGDVVDVGNKMLPSILDGSTSVQDGLGQMAAAWQALPEANRGSSYQ